VTRYQVVRLHLVISKAHQVEIETLLVIHITRNAAALDDASPRAIFELLAI